jgi:hypothetical protein
MKPHEQGDQMKRRLPQVSTGSGFLKVRTFLGLTGGIVLVLYMLFRLILGLGIFSKLGDTETLTVLRTIIDRVFALALIAVTVSSVAYLTAALRGQPSRSKVPPTNPEEPITIADIDIVNTDQYKLTQNGSDLNVKRRPSAK